MLLIVDIDGTIADATRRFAEAGPEPSKNNKPKFLEWLGKVQNENSLMADQPVPGMRELIAGLTLGWRDSGERVRVAYLTSREEKWRSVTEQWLEKNQFPKTHLVTRPNGCWMETAEFKSIAIHAMRQNNEHVIVVDDDDQHGSIEKMCKKNGYTFLKARSGGQK